MHIIGIDPGASGAIAFLAFDGTASVADLPIVPIVAKSKRGRIKNRIDSRALFRLIGEMIPADDVAVAIIEDVQPLAMPGINVSQSANGSMMRTKGAIEATLELHSRVQQVLWVPPQEWQKALNLIGIKPKDRKEESRRVARQLFPTLTTLRRKMDHNRAEALLIAYYGRAMLA